MVIGHSSPTIDNGPVCAETANGFAGLRLNVLANDFQGITDANSPKGKYYA
jgi:hypothetical protein